MLNLKVRHWIILVGSIAFLLFLNSFFGVGNQAVVYDLPPHFKGWVLLQFEDPTCVPLSSEMWSRHWVIPEYGSSLTGRWPRDRFPERF